MVSSQPLFKNWLLKILFGVAIAGFFVSSASELEPSYSHFTHASSYQIVDGFLFDSSENLEEVEKHFLVSYFPYFHLQSHLQFFYFNLLSTFHPKFSYLLNYYSLPPPVSLS